MNSASSIAQSGLRLHIRTRVLHVEAGKEVAEEVSKQIVIVHKYLIFLRAREPKSARRESEGNVGGGETTYHVPNFLYTLLSLSSSLLPLARLCPVVLVRLHPPARVQGASSLDHCARMQA